MIEGKLTGTADYKLALQSIPKKLRRRALMKALKAAARPIRDTARAATPILSSLTVAPFRKPGTVRKAIAVRTSKLARKAGDVGVFVNIRPLFRGRIRLAAKGVKAQSADDPFYWQFINFGTKYMRGFHFLEAGARRFPQALTIFENVLGPELKKLERDGKDPL